MVVKFYISMISGNKEIKKFQMKAQLIMESKGVDFKVIDICDPNCEDERRFMQKNAQSKPGARNPVPPQFFNDEEYCGDYDGFDEANESDRLEEFLKLPRGSLPQVPIINHNLSNFSSREVSMEKEIVNTNMNGFSSHRETPEKANHAPTTHEEEEEDEYEEDEEQEAEGDKGEPSGSVVADGINEDVVLKQQSSTLESQKQQSNYSDEEEDEEEEEEEEHKTDASENLKASQQSSGINSMAANEQRDQNETGASETQPSLKASDNSTVEEATEAGIVRDGREQSPGEEHDEESDSCKGGEHGQFARNQAKEHDLDLANVNQLDSSDVSVNEQLASSDAVQKHAIQDDSHGQQSSGTEQQPAAKQSSENDSAQSGERVEANNERAEEEDEEDEEESEEEEEEDEENKKIISALPDEDDLMEMSTTVATAERFTEFSYKQLPGEA